METSSRTVDRIDREATDKFEKYLTDEKKVKDFIIYLFLNFEPESLTLDDLVNPEHTKQRMDLDENALSCKQHIMVRRGCLLEACKRGNVAVVKVLLHYVLKRQTESLETQTLFDLFVTEAQESTQKYKRKHPTKEPYDIALECLKEASRHGKIDLASKILASIMKNSNKANQVEASFESLRYQS